MIRDPLKMPIQNLQGGVYASLEVLYSTVQKAKLSRDLFEKLQVCSDYSILMLP